MGVYRAGRCSCVCMPMLLWLVLALLSLFEGRESILDNSPSSLFLQERGEERWRYALAV
jgi:hypothetical protein